MRPPTRRRAGLPPSAGQLVARFGGRFSRQLGIDLDAGAKQADRWFLAATLFGTRISTNVALRTYQTMAESGVRTIEDVGRRTWSELVDLLDRGGYVRYDYKTASRLLELAAATATRYPGGLKALSQMDPDQLQAGLDALPGWGPVTVRLFLRELRGVWPGAQLPVDPRALSAARHLGWQPPRKAPLTWLRRRARAAGVDVRDLEAALVRSSLRHGLAAVPAKLPRPVRLRT